MSLTFAPLVLASVGTVALSILAIGFLIFVHELGHFLACRLTKTRVETFSIGFGPRLFGWERDREGRRRFTVGERQLSPHDHAMDVRIAAVPLGGYVKMAGEIGGDATPGDPRDRDARAPAPDEFPAKPFWARFTIIVAGVFMNAVTAFALLTLAYGIGVSDSEPLLGTVQAGGPAWRAGLETGDRILSIDGKPMRTFLDIRGETPLLRRDTPIDIEVERDGVRRTVRARPERGDEGLPLLRIGEAGSWTIGKGPDAFVVGPVERVSVAGRVVVGGVEAIEAAQEASALGRTPVRIERLDGSGKSVEVPAGTQSEARIGVLPYEGTVVEAVLPGSPAAAAGLLAGDRIVAADGEPLARRADLAFRRSIDRLEVRRDGETKTLAASAGDPAAVAAFLRGVAFQSSKEPRADIDLSFPGGSPAAQAGLKPGDVILEIDGAAVSSVKEIAPRVRAAEGRALRLKVRTGDEPPRELSVTPRSVLSAIASPETFDFSAARTVVGGEGVGAAFALGWQRTTREFKNLFRMIRSFFTGDIRADKAVGGPGTLIYYSERSVSQGTLFLVFLAIISVNLAVLNILPIPILDGGQLLFLVVEKLRGRPLREATIAKAQLVGLFLLLALMAFALSNDFKLLF